MLISEPIPGSATSRLDFVEHQEELVLVRQDEATLGAIETGILNRIRQETKLCRLPLASAEVAAYRVAGPGGCEGPDTDPR